MIRYLRAAVVALRDVRATYWFLPALLTIAAVLLAVLILALDRHVVGTPAWLGWTHGGGADGALRARRLTMRSACGSLTATRVLRALDVRRRLSQ